MLALGGVVWSTIHSARQNRLAENRRATATIEAEDRRAVAAIEAEDRRHAHAIEAERKRRVIEARHDFYERLEVARRPLIDALNRVQYNRLNGHVAAEDLRQLDRAVGAFREVRAQAGLYASKAVEAAAGQTWTSAAFASMTLEMEQQGDDGGGSEEKVLSRIRVAQTAAQELQRLLRAEAGVED